MKCSILLLAAGLALVPPQAMSEQYTVPSANVKAQRGAITAEMKEELGLPKEQRLPTRALRPDIVHGMLTVPSRPQANLNIVVDKQNGQITSPTVNYRTLERALSKFDSNDPATQTNIIAPISQHIRNRTNGDVVPDGLYIYAIDENIHMSLLPYGGNRELRLNLDQAEATLLEACDQALTSGLGFVYNGKQRATHDYLFDGCNVLVAGEVHIKDGKIQRISNMSGHYMPHIWNLHYGVGAFYYLHPDIFAPDFIVSYVGAGGEFGHRRIENLTWSHFERQKPWQRELESSMRDVINYITQPSESQNLLRAIQNKKQQLLECQTLVEWHRVGGYNKKYSPQAQEFISRLDTEAQRLESNKATEGLTLQYADAIQSNHPELANKIHTLYQLVYDQHVQELRTTTSNLDTVRQQATQKTKYDMTHLEELKENNSAVNSDRAPNLLKWIHTLEEFRKRNPQEYESLHQALDLPHYEQWVQLTLREKCFKFGHEIPPYNWGTQNAGASRDLMSIFCQQPAPSQTEIDFVSKGATIYNCVSDITHYMLWRMFYLNLLNEEEARLKDRLEKRTNEMRPYSTRLNPLRTTNAQMNELRKIVGEKYTDAATQHAADRFLKNNKGKEGSPLTQRKN